MSVLIKGMKMPINCYECRFGCWPSDGSRPYCILTDEDADEPDYCSKRMAHCHLVPIPPHGRLIDADTLTVKHGWLDNFDNTHTHIQFVYANEINYTPTIIESEEEDD